MWKQTLQKQETSSLRIVGFFSFFFAILTLLASFISAASFNGILYAWVVTVNIGVGVLQRNRQRYLACALMLSVPLFLLERTPVNLTVIGMLFLLSCFFIHQELGVRDYFSTLGQFRHEMPILASVLILAVPTGRYEAVGEQIVLYFIIYLISTIMLLRTLRVLESSSSPGLIRQTNLKYSVALVAASLLLGIDAVRALFADVIGFFYESFAAVFIFLSQLVFRALYLTIKIIIKLLGMSSDGAQDKGDDILKTDILRELARKSRYRENGDPFYFHLVLGLLLLLVCIAVIYFVYRRHVGVRTSDHASFTEEKEFIEKDRNTDKGLRKLLSKLTRPKDANEQVRFYYVRFLKLCLDNKIGLSKSDSSLEVNRKAAPIFSKALLEQMRSIYIKARYSGMQLEEGSKNEFLTCYDSLKKECSQPALRGSRRKS